MTSKNTYKTPEGRKEIINRISVFLDTHGEIPMLRQQLRTEADEGIKAGVVPFWREIMPNGTEQYHFYLLKPLSKHGDSLKFQIAKGKKEKLPESESFEAHPVTALREGWEEVGLVPEDIKSLYDMGRYEYSSESEGGRRPVWIYAAEVRSKNIGEPLQGEKTVSRAWCTIGKPPSKEIRSDHIPILNSVEKSLMRHFNSQTVSR